MKVLTFIYYPYVSIDIYLLKCKTSKIYENHMKITSKSSDSLYLKKKNRKSESLLKCACKEKKILCINHL